MKLTSNPSLKPAGVKTGVLGVSPCKPPTPIQHMKDIPSDWPLSARILRRLSRPPEAAGFAGGT